MGLGLFQREVANVLEVAEVGKEMEYHIRFQFTDPYNGAKVTHSEHYELHVSAPH